MTLVGAGVPPGVRMPPPGAGPRIAARRRPFLPPGWPLSALFLGFPLWWALGMSDFMLTVFAAPMLVELVRRRHHLVVPRGFGLWLLFLVWLAAGVLVLFADAPGARPGGASGRYISYGYRASAYVAITIAFLYVVNLRPEELSARRVMRLLGAMFVITAAGGALGVLAPTFEFRSLMELILPRGIAQHPLLRDLIHPSAAQIQYFLGRADARPRAPFPYTNEWGANLALFLPFFVVTWFGRDAGWRRALAPLVAGVALIAVIASLNRAVWAGIVLAGAYTLVRLAAAKRTGAVVAVTVSATMLVILLVSTPLLARIEERLATPHSDQRRSLLVRETLDSALGSPVVGFGTTRPAEGNAVTIAGGATATCPQCGLPPFGTHGHLWLVIFSQGYVGTLIFASFFLVRWRRLRRDPHPYAIAAAAATLMWVFFSFFYNSIPYAILAVMLGLAASWRRTTDAVAPGSVAGPARRTSP